MKECFLARLFSRIITGPVAHKNNRQTPKLQALVYEILRKCRKAMLGVWLTPSHRTSMPFLYSLRLIVMGLEWRRRVSEVKHTGRTQATGTFPSVTSSASALMSVTASTGIVSNCHGLCSHRAPTGIVSNCHGPCSDAHHWRRFKLPWFMQ